MKTVTSISGGRTSAYLAANYPSDYNVFALVRTDDKECLFPDPVLRRIVEDRIQAPFVGTLEDDMIIYTILDLEQFIGRRIEWVTDVSFDELLRSEAGMLPSIHRRFCTQNLKIRPIFNWWYENIGEPVEVRIGYRSDKKEIARANDMLSKTNAEGLLEFETTFEKHSSGRHVGLNKWVKIPWEKPVFKLIEDGVRRDQINKYWEGKPVRFAAINNCIHCFNKIPPLLRTMWNYHPSKMNWAKRQEFGRQPFDTWKEGITYAEIENWKVGASLLPTEYGPCDSGYCGI
ncbi:hypothetical protein JMG10_07675 [Nostoc ellipsosporum NOK]|nr:hypothetical protein [Nostoc ellipsosporum NOK]